MQQSKQKKANKAPKGQRTKANPPKRANSGVPASYATTKRSTPLRFTAQMGDGRILVRNEEFITDISGSVAFATQSISVNPGLSKTFPWLSNLANNYEFYHFKKLEFHYRPYVGTQSAGSVILAVDYDAADAPATTKARMMTYSGSVMGPVYRDLTLRAAPTNLSKMGTQKYTRPGDVPAGKDVKTYDVANLFIGTDNGTIAAVGSLFVQYEVELMTPHTPDAFPWEDSARVSAVSADKAHPLAGGTAVVGDSADPVVAIRDTNSFYIKKAGEYMISVLAAGTGLTNVALTTVLGLVGLEVPASFSGAIVPATGFQYLAEGVVTTLVNNAIAEFAIPAAWTTLAGLTVRIAPYKRSLA